MYIKTWLQFTRESRDQFEELLVDALELHKSFTDEGMDAKTAFQATGIIGTHMAKTVLEINGYNTSTLAEQAVFETIVINICLLPKPYQKNYINYLQAMMLPRKILKHGTTKPSHARNTLSTS